MRLQLCRCRVVRFCITVDIVRDGGRRNVGVRTCAVWPLPWNSSLTHRHSRAQPPPLQSSRAAATAAWRAPRPAPCNRQQRRLLVHDARARASRRRAPRAAASNSVDDIDYGLCYGLAPVRDRAVHMQPNLSVRRLVRGLELIIAQHSPLRGYSTHTHWCSALVRQRLGGVGGSAPAHAQQRRTPAQQAANRPSPRDDARAA